MPDSPPTLTRVSIDLNVRVRGRQTLAGLEDVHGPIEVGQLVEVFEEESGAYGPGYVMDIDTKKRLVYLSVDWAGMRLPEADCG